MVAILDYILGISKFQNGSALKMVSFRNSCSKKEIFLIEILTKDGYGVVNFSSSWVKVNEMFLQLKFSGLKVDNTLFYNFPFYSWTDWFLKWVSIPWHQKFITRTYLKMVVISKVINFHFFKLIGLCKCQLITCLHKHTTPSDSNVCKL